MAVPTSLPRPRYCDRFGSAARLHADPLPESNSISEAFVKTLKRDYTRHNILPNADTVILPAWFENDVAPEAYPVEVESGQRGPD